MLLAFSHRRGLTRASLSRGYIVRRQRSMSAPVLVHRSLPALVLMFGALLAACHGCGGSVGAGQVTLSPGTLDFGMQPVGQTSAPKSVNLHNSGPAPLAITSVAVSGDYAQMTVCGGTLAPGASCSVAVTFTPRGSGARTGALLIGDDVSSAKHQVALSGSGLLAGPEAHLVPSSLDFGPQVVGRSSSPRAVTLTNSGAQDLALQSISTEGDYAESNDCPSILHPGSACTVQVSVTPTATGSRPGTLSFQDSAADAPQHVALSATGIPGTPAVSLDPGQLVFGTWAVGVTSPGQTVTVHNDGTGPLAISGITTSGDFARTTTCGNSLGPGGSCTVTVTFTPTAGGGRSGTLSVSDDASGSPQTVALSGTGVAAGPVASLSPGGLDFGSVRVAQPSPPRTVTLTNSGDSVLHLSGISSSGDYQQTSGCGASLAPRASCAIQVTFTPASAGTRSGRLSVTDDAPGSPQTVSLTGTGVSGPGVSLAPGSVDFGSVMVGQPSAPRAVTLTNTGGSTLHIAAVAATGDYSQTNACGGTLGPGASCTVQLTFRPTGPGTRTGTLTVTDDAPGSPQTVSLTGSGVTGPAASVSPGTLSFGNVRVGQPSAPRTVTLTNTGGSTLHIASVAATGDYSLTNGCGSTLGPGASCTVQVTFTPAATGARSGTLSVTDDAPGSPRTVSLTGIGVSGPGVSLGPGSLDFGNVRVGQASSPRTVTLTNTGGSTLNVTSVAVSGDYSQTNVCGNTLGPGSSCTIQVTFRPGATGTRTGTLSVTDDAPGSPQTAALTGTGVSGPAVSLGPGSLNFGSVTVGQSSAPRAVTVTNTGGSPLNITSVAVSGDYSRTSGCGSTLAAGANCTVQVTFTPTATGTRTGTLSVTDDAPGSPQTAALTGQGTGGGGGAVYPLRVHASGRYLVDQNGTPWRIQADAAWLMSSNATAAEVDTYLSTRRGQGFNSFYLMAMVHPGGYGQAPGAPNDAAGHPPFATPNDFSTAGVGEASAAYWAWIDSIVDKAAAQGMVVMLAYTYLGYAGGAQGWASVVVQQASRQVCSDWGRWLGNRYKSKPNIIWFALGDYTPPSGSELEARTLLILQGIKAAGATQPFMAEPSGGDSNPILDAPAFASSLDLNSFYGYGPTGRGDLYPQAARAYGVSPPKPAWVQEGGYEFENNTGAFTGQSYETRRTRLWSVLAGGTAGDGFGSLDAWSWQGFPGSLHTAGATFSTAAFQLFAAMPWWDLRPSGVGPGLAGKTLVTAGGGTFGNMDWVTAAVTSTGSHLLAYIPTVGATGSRTLTIDMSAMAGATRARWWDPSNGTSSSIGTGFANSGTRSFTSPGANAGGQNDWVLVLESP